MLFSAGMAVLLAVELIALVVATVKAKKGRKFITFVVMVLLIGITGKFALFPPYKEIETTGKYSVISSDYWVQENRTEAFADDGSMREVQVRAWYPENYKGKEHSAPVAVFSHGSCGTIDNNVSLYKEMASNGYVVLAVAHTYHAFTTVTSDNRKIPVSTKYLSQISKVQPSKDPQGACAIYKDWMTLRMIDLECVMDDFKQKTLSDTSEYCRIANADGFIVGGHSAGGSAAYGVARERSDIIACIGLEAPFMHDILGVEDGKFIFNDEEYDIPLLNIYTDASYSHLRSWPEYKENANLLDSDNEDIVNIYYKGYGHMDICDLSLSSPLLSSILDGKFTEGNASDRLKQLNEDVMKFLNDCVITED